MSPLQFCLPKLKWNHTTFHICHSEVGALRVSVAEDFHLVIGKSTQSEVAVSVHKTEPHTGHHNVTREERGMSRGSSTMPV